MMRYNVSPKPTGSKDDLFDFYTKLKNSINMTNLVPEQKYKWKDKYLCEAIQRSRSGCKMTTSKSGDKTAISDYTDLSPGNISNVR